MKTVDETPRPFWKKIDVAGDYLGCQCNGVGVVATIFKLLMTAAGMKTH